MNRRRKPQITITVDACMRDALVALAEQQDRPVSQVAGDLWTAGLLCVGAVPLRRELSWALQ